MNLNTNRVLVLKPMDGGAMSSTGLVDKRLFTGDNKLHAIKDPETCLWSLKYDIGGLPPHLKNQVFTGFKALYKYCEDYFRKRNIAITEVID